jgi:putrescine aminotransferase
VGEAVMTGLVGRCSFVPTRGRGWRFPEKAEVGLICREHSIAAGLVMRAVGDRMVVSPPLILSHEEADTAGRARAHRARPDRSGCARLGLI